EGVSGSKGSSARRSLSGAFQDGATPDRTRSNSLRRDDDHALHAERLQMDPAEELVATRREPVRDRADHDLLAGTNVPREPQRRDRHVVEVPALVPDDQVAPRTDRQRGMGVVEVVVDRRYDVRPNLAPRQGSDQDEGRDGGDERHEPSRGRTLRARSTTPWPGTGGVGRSGGGRTSPSARPPRRSGPRRGRASSSPPRERNPSRG